MTEWRERAACSGSPEPDLWFSAPTETADRWEALSICRTCTVQTECLDYALTEQMPFGIWGGMTPDQIRIIQRRRQLTREKGKAK